MRTLSVPPYLHLEIDPRRLSCHFREIKALADSERNGLGFIPEQALRDSIDRRKMLALVDRSREKDRLVGYLLYSGVFPHAKVQQIATVKDWRQQGVASALVRSMATELERLGFMTIRADVASDLDAALAFYAKNGFERIRARAGGASRKRQIIIHERGLETDTLFTRVTDSEHGMDLGIRRRSAGEAPFFALDLNVYFDLAMDRMYSESARRLFGAALDHQIRLTVSDEFVQELNRTSEDRTRDPILQLALRLPRMPPADRLELDVRQKQMHDLIFVQSGVHNAESSQAQSDAGHLAHAALARASAFVTRDGMILGARATLIERFGIDVVTVDELLAILPADHVGKVTAPQSGRGFVYDDASFETIRNYMNSQCLPPQVVNEFAMEGRHLVDFTRKVVRRNDDVLACAVLLAPRTTEPICRLIVHARPEALDGELYTDHLLDVLLREASANAATSVELECVPGQSTLISLAKARGFVKQSSTSTLTKVVIGRPVTANTWKSATQELRMRTGLELPPEMPVGDKAESFTVRTNQGISLNVSLRGLEDILGPTLLVWPDRNGVIVPITQSYSELLLGAGRQMSLGLIDEKDAAFLSKRAYVNTPRAAGVMRSESPILFYESMRNEGAGSIVAIGRIVDAMILNKDDIPSESLRRIVVNDVGAFSNNQDVLVTSFDNLFALPNPVPFHVLKDMGAVDGSNFVTATRAIGRSISEIVDKGWRSEQP